MVDDIKSERWARSFRNGGRHRAEPAKHFKTKYAGEQPPIWIAAELWDFGAMSVLYSGMRKPGQDAVAQLFGVSSFKIMETWLRALSPVRDSLHLRLSSKNN
jgi:abortive infection bacteriophage resistance protein